LKRRTFISLLGVGATGLTTLSPTLLKACLNVEVKCVWIRNIPAMILIKHYEAAIFYMESQYKVTFRDTAVAIKMRVTDMRNPPLVIRAIPPNSPILETGVLLFIHSKSKQIQVGSSPFVHIIPSLSILLR
jgi:hypothetical protein